MNNTNTVGCRVPEITMPHSGVRNPLFTTVIHKKMHWGVFIEDIKRDMILYLSFIIMACMFFMSGKLRASSQNKYDSDITIPVFRASCDIINIINEPEKIQYEIECDSERLKITIKNIGDSDILLKHENNILLGQSVGVPPTGFLVVRKTGAPDNSSAKFFSDSMYSSGVSLKSSVPLKSHEAISKEYILKSMLKSALQSFGANSSSSPFRGYKWEYAIIVCFDKTNQIRFKTKDDQSYYISNWISIPADLIK